MSLESSQGFALRRSLVLCALMPLLLLLDGCASVLQNPLENPTRIPPQTARSLRTAIKAHDDGRAVTELNQIKTHLTAPLQPNEKKTLDQWLRLAADQGAACPHHLVRELIDAGASLEQDDLHSNLKRWLTCRGLMEASFNAQTQPEKKLSLARALLEGLPRQVEAASLATRKAILMENRPLGQRILKVTDEQFADYGKLFHTLQNSFDELCSANQAEYCPLQQESRRLRDWFQAEAERKRGLVFKSQIDKAAQAAFLEWIDTVYGPFLRPD